MANKKTGGFAALAILLALAVLFSGCVTAGQKLSGAAVAEDAKIAAVGDGINSLDTSAVDNVTDVPDFDPNLFGP
jgi:hypothetical protein